MIPSPRRSPPSRVLPALLAGSLALCSAVFAEDTRGISMSVTGVILESGISAMVLQVPGNNKGVKYNTGRETRFSPEDYLPAKGDTVKIDYYPKRLSNGEELLAISTLSLIQMAPGRRELTSPAEGFITEIGRKNIRFDFPRHRAAAFDGAEAGRGAGPRRLAAGGGR